MGSGWRNALAAFGVLLGLGGLVAVPAALDASLPAEGPLPPGDRLDVGYGVTLRPPPGARLDMGASRPGTGEVVLLRSGQRLAVSAVDVRERPDDFVSHARRKFARDDGLSVGPPAEVRTTAGIRGQRADLRVEDDWFGGRPGCAAIFTGRAGDPAEPAEPDRPDTGAGADVAVAVDGMVGVVAVISPVDGCAAVPPDLWEAVTSLKFEEAELW